MAISETFGGTTNTSYSMDSSYVQSSVPLITTVNQAYDLTRPIKLTQLRTYLGSYDGVGNIVATLAGFTATFNNVAIDSSPPLSSWATLSGSYVDTVSASSFTFRLNPSTQGGIYFKRGGSGTTVQETSGYTWNSRLFGEYKYLEAPMASENFVATASGTAGLVTFSWTASNTSSATVAPITGYDIYRGLSSTTVTTYIGSTTGTSFSYTAPDSTAYRYHVRVRNSVTEAAGTTSLASNVSTATANFTSVASNPSNMVATPSTTGRIDLTWSAPVTAPATYGYKIYQNGVLINTIAISSNPSEAYSVTGLTPGVSYSFYVTSTASGGDSGSSNTATATAPGFAAAASALSVTSIITTTALASVEVPKQLRLSWTEPASMTNTGGYKIYRDGVQIAGAGSVAGTIIGRMTNPTYIDSDPALVAGTQYSYTIRAYLAASTEVGTLTAPVTGIPVNASIQEVTDTVANLTNTEFDGIYDNLVTVINPTTFSYPVTDGTAYSVQSVDDGFGTVSGSLLEIFGIDRTIATVPTTKSFTFAFSSALPSISPAIGVSAVATNKTNAALSGTSFTVDPSTSTGTSTVYYSVTNAALPASITAVATTGVANNLDSGVINDTLTAVVSVPTALSFTYTKSGAGIATDQAEALTTGTVTIPANKNIYNAVDKLIASVPRYDTVVYTTTVANSGATSEDVSPTFPNETARRTTSIASAEIEYRSGWIG